MPKSNSQRLIDCRTSREHHEDDSNIAGTTLARLWGVGPQFFANFICEIPDFPEMVALAGLEPYYPAHDALNAMIALAERDETVEALANYGEGTPVADLKPGEPVAFVPWKDRIANIAVAMAGVKDEAEVCGADWIQMVTGCEISEEFVAAVPGFPDDISGDMYPAAAALRAILRHLMNIQHQGSQDFSVWDNGKWKRPEKVWDASTFKVLSPEAARLMETSRVLHEEGSARYLGNLGDVTDQVAAQLPDFSHHQVTLDERGFVSGIKITDPAEAPPPPMELFDQLRDLLERFPDTLLAEHGINIKRETGEWRWLAEAITQALIREGRDKAAKSFTDGIETKAVSIGISQAFLGHLAAVLDEVGR